MESMLNKDSFYSKSFVIFIRHPEMLTLGGTPCSLGGQDKGHNSDSYRVSHPRCSIEGHDGMRGTPSRQLQETMIV